MFIEELIEQALGPVPCKLETSADGMVITVPLGSDRTQRVRVASFEASGGRYLRITSAIGSHPALDLPQARAMLGLNLRIPHGAFAVHGDLLIITDTLPIDIDPTTLGNVIRFIADQADRYESHLFQGDAT